MKNLSQLSLVWRGSSSINRRWELASLLGFWRRERSQIRFNLKWVIIGRVPLLALRNGQTRQSWLSFFLFLAWDRASEPILLHLFHELEGLVRPTNGIRFESDSRSIHIKTAHLKVLSGDSLNDSNLTRHRVSAAFPKPTPSLASKPEEGQQLTETSPLAGKSRDPLSPLLLFLLFRINL